MRFSVESSPSFANSENCLTSTHPTEMLDSMLYACLSNLLWTRSSLCGRPRQLQNLGQPRLGGAKQALPLGPTR